MKLSVNLKDCFGIKSLEKYFDFSESNTFVIYAPNGVMKMSFAKTVKTLIEGKIPNDQISPSLKSKYDFILDKGGQMDAKQFCVIEPYNEKAFESENNILLLLSDEGKKKEYFEIYKEIEALKKSSLTGLKKISGSSNFESEIIDTFSYLGKKNIYEILKTILIEIKSSKDEFDFSYNEIFDPKGKVKIFLEKNSVLLDEYLTQYKELIKKSSFFNSNDEASFGTSEAKNLIKGLDGGAYFSVGYKLLLSSKNRIISEEELTQTIDDEIDKIFSDEKLKKTFEKIDKSLDANIELKKLKKVLDKKPELLIHLREYEKFRQAVWYSFLRKLEPGIVSLVELYDKKKNKLEKLIQEAQDNKSAWQDAIDEFENRFIDMPFKMNIKNKPDAVLNNVTPTLEFSFKGKAIDRKRLVDNILSQGEKRAFYILNVIFEIKIRQRSDEKTLFIIDDIADSFDYKNKYAIVEYLRDITEYEKEDGVKYFYSIILTHNFDFYRTISSRLKIADQNKLHAEKSDTKVTLDVEKFSGDPFKEWKRDLCKKNIIALIPFVRNLIEYGKDDKKDFMLLTHLLHKKSDLSYDKKGKRIKVINGSIVKGEQEEIIRDYCESESIGDFTLKETDKITFKDIQEIYKKYLGVGDFDEDILICSVYKEIIKLADSWSSGSSLECKIIFAIAIRLKTEEFMINEINNPNWIDKISSSQTSELVHKYVRKCTPDKTQKEILERVNIMTPENIHLNSFMYEPILDMGIDELRNLYCTSNELKKQ